MTFAINATWLALTKAQESCRLEAYWDPYGQCWSIGYGQTGPNIRAGLRITQAQADAFLEESMATAVKALNQFVKVPLNANQVAALGDFTYNAGAGNLENLVNRTGLNNKNYANVPPHLKLYVYGADGRRVQDLVNRRADEVKLWNTPIESEAVS